MNYLEVIKDKVKELNGIITTKDLKDYNIPPVYLTRMVRSGELERVGRGIYLDPKCFPDDYYFFQQRFSVPIFSYVSALFLHDLTDRIPYETEITVYKGYNAKNIEGEVKVHYVSKEIFELGVTECETMGGKKVRTYDLERTVCDLIKNRHKVDAEVFCETMKRYMGLKDRDLRKLYQYSKKMNIFAKVRAVLEVLV